MYKLYLVPNPHLVSMNVGKMVAQASHAANDFQTYCQKNNFLAFQEWQKQGGSYGTAITLYFDENMWDSCYNGEIDYPFLPEKPIRDFAVGKVIDETYPFDMTMEIYNLLDQEIRDYHERFCGVPTSKHFTMVRKETTFLWWFGHMDDRPLVLKKAKLYGK